MLRKIVNAYAFIYACLFVFSRFVMESGGRQVLDKLDAAGEWMEYQVDHNDYLAGFLLALVFFAIPYILGIISIVFVEG